MIRKKSTKIIYHEEKSGKYEYLNGQNEYYLSQPHQKCLKIGKKEHEVSQ